MQTTNRTRAIDAFISIYAAVGIIVGNRYMRGCLDRLLLFGIDPDLRDAMANVGEADQCRVTNRKLLSLVNSNPQPEPSSQPSQRASVSQQRASGGRQRARQPVRTWQADLVVVCSCIGDRCNKSPMNLSRRASRTTTASTSLPILLLPSAVLAMQFARRGSTLTFLISN